MYAMQSRPTPSSTPLAQLIRFARQAQRLVPGTAHRHALALALNRSLGPALRRGELDFLRGRQVRITVPDLNLDFAVTVPGQRLDVTLTPTSPDVTFRADAQSLLRITAGKVDPDTLFFRRKLAIEGDTELGLALKNFLDSQDPEQLIPPPLYRLIDRLTT